MSALRLRFQTPLGRGIVIVSALLVLAGLVGLVTGVDSPDAARTFAALISSWLFFAGLAMGALAFAALMSLCGARWAEPITDIARSFTRFIPIAAVLLLVVLFGVSRWAPFYQHVPAQQAFWLDTPLMATREILGSTILFGFALLYMRPGSGKLPGWVAITYLILFAGVVSMWAFDFVLGTDLTWSSTLIGPHLFSGAFISGAALSTVVALYRGVLDKKQRHDTGALMVALGIFWGYLFWSQYLTIWYGNLPDEVEYFIRRGSGGWQIEVVAMALCIVAVPLLLLLTARGKESPKILGLAALLQLGGLWMERHLMVVPSVAAQGSTPFDVHGLLVALGLLGAFALTTGEPAEPGALPERTGEPKPRGKEPALGPAALGRVTIGQTAADDGR